MPAEILCCGEALIDMLPRISEQGESAFAPHTGGAVYNTAIALGRLGAPAGYFGGLSRDLFGQLLEEDLNAARVEAGLAPRSDAPTTLAFVTLRDGHATYAFYDENTAGRMLSEDDLPALPETVTTLFFGGISLVSEPCADSFAALAAREADKRLIMLDPNIRPGFIRDEARYRARLERMLALADVVKVSDEDLDWITGTTDPNALIAHGVKLVLMTRGAEGVTAVSAHGTRNLPANKVEVVDTVGAGDTFNAGFLAGLHQAGLATKGTFAAADLDALAPAITLGMRAAAVTVSRAGANPPWAEELA
ncbi:carbohydrate kinase [Primorskyibacter aestuariivivens]|uniref:carbohydrate kinase family protein n=1 Tax=Primorskyibacter aestuariivivens TaxID=1888912 RepID=UPI00230135A8|nr:carbohydrate kinase [Primorskyibacter aestuariivivens]MDA7428080.1 carbohydrate kinase [Primorskyibacter aestuariivivens]